jgi:heme-degrading monooxygenase HmoA
MFARARITHGAPEKVEEGIRHFQDVVVQSYKDVSGFKGGYMLVDRKKGKLIGVTLWATEADMHATEATSQRLRTAGSRAAGGEVHSVEIYEVAVHP